VFSRHPSNIVGNSLPLSRGKNVALGIKDASSPKAARDVRPNNRSDEWPWLAAWKHLVY